MDRITEVVAKFDEYITAVKAFFLTIEEAKAAAVAADDAEENEALQAFIAKIDAARAELPAPPVTPEP